MIKSIATGRPHFPGWLWRLQRAAFFISIFLQAGITAGALAAAWALRFDFSFPHARILLESLPILLVFRVIAIYHFHLGHGYWRFAGITDAVNILKAVLASSAAFFLAIQLLNLPWFPRSVYPLEIIISCLGLGGCRFGVRAILMSTERQNRAANSTRAVIVGAGFAGQMLVRELLRPGSTHFPVVFADDDSGKWGAQIHGVPVEGDVSKLRQVVEKYKAEEVLIAVPSATREQMFRIVECCHNAGVRFRSIPSLAEITSGRIQVGELREIALEDLLGRDPVHLDLEPVRRLLEQQVVMVTGAAGSIGSELCSQILNFGPKMMICVDHDETGLFNLEQDMTRRPGKTVVRYCVEDIADRDRMRALMTDYRVDFVFHAAAYKHVPLMERNARKALLNNVFALRQLVELAEEAGVHSFVMISSDKAVNPTNVMGCTKRIGELLLAARQNRRMRCVSVRFGNVLGSQGSVVPIFQQQIREGRPITITHPEMTRFFMTISESVSLVLQAFVVGEHGDILVLDMGAPVSIVRMAKTLINLCGHSDREVPIVYSGLRPGEKLYEELFYASEKPVRTSCQKVMRTQGQIVHWSELETRLRKLESLLNTGSDEQLKRGMSAIVPEYGVAEPGTPAVRRIDRPAAARAAAVGLD